MTAKTSGTIKRQVEHRLLDALVPFARNARTHSDEQVAQIAASIKEWGWTSPILIDEVGGVIAGHGRLLAARKLGMAEAPCIVLDGLTDTQKRALVIADNKLALNAGWDAELLSSELAGLGEDGFDMALLGFSDDELAIEDELFGGRIHAVDTSQVNDLFWISVSGPLRLQAAALDGLKVAMAEIPGLEITLGTVRRDG